MQRVANFRRPVFGGATVAHYKPRFRFSIKDLATGKKLTVELRPVVAGTFLDPAERPSVLVASTTCQVSRTYA